MKASQRVRLRLLAWSVSMVLTICAVVFLSLAGYLALATRLDRPLAALATGGALLVLTVLVLLGTRWLTGRRSQRASRRNDGFEALLEEQLDPLVSRWIDRHPEGAAAGTLLLGIAAGYSGSVRRVLQDMFDNYAESEINRRRRSRAREDGEPPR